MIKKPRASKLTSNPMASDNNMKLNQDKCHLLVCGYKHENVWAQIGGKIIWENNNQKFLGLQIDRNLDFNVFIVYYP